VRCSSCFRLSRIQGRVEFVDWGLSLGPVVVDETDICCDTALRFFINASDELRCARSSTNGRLAFATRLAI